MSGFVRWEFFTEGYKALRVTQVYPRPYSRVRPRHTPLIISFNRPLYRGVDASGWLSVKVGGGVSRSAAGGGSSVGGVAAVGGSDGGSCGLKAAWYDELSCSLVFDPLEGSFPPAATIRVRVRAQRVCGSKGESLEPLQGDGLLKTSSFRWSFFTTHGSSEVSRYEFNNVDSAGVAAVLQRYPDCLFKRMCFVCADRGTHSAGVAGVLQRCLRRRQRCLSVSVPQSLTHLRQSQAPTAS